MRLLADLEAPLSVVSNITGSSRSGSGMPDESHDKQDHCMAVAILVIIR